MATENPAAPQPSLPSGALGGLPDALKRAWRQVADAATAGQAAHTVRATRPPLPTPLPAAGAGAGAGARQRGREERGNAMRTRPTRPPLPGNRNRDQNQGQNAGASRLAGHLAPLEPVSVTWLARSAAPHVLSADDPQRAVTSVANGFTLMVYPLPFTLLGVVQPGAPLMLLNTRLFPALETLADDEMASAYQRLALEPSALGGAMMERLIEGSLLARLVVAALYLRWHQWAHLAAAQFGADASGVFNLRDVATGTSVYALGHPYAVGWAALDSDYTQKRIWDARHGALYSLLWRRLGQLLAPQRSIVAAARIYVRGYETDYTDYPDGPSSDPASAPPRFGDIMARLRAPMWDAGRAYGAHNPAQAEAWAVADIAARLRVPRTLIRSRLEDDWTIQAGADGLAAWGAVSDWLAREMPELGGWRAEVARAHNLLPERVALMLHEPAMALAGPHGELPGWTPSDRAPVNDRASGRPSQARLVSRPLRS